MKTWMCPKCRKYNSEEDGDTCACGYIFGLLPFPMVIVDTSKMTLSWLYAKNRSFTYPILKINGKDEKNIYYKYVFVLQKCDLNDIFKKLNGAELIIDSIDVGNIVAQSTSCLPDGLVSLKLNTTMVENKIKTVNEEIKKQDISEEEFNKIREDIFNV